MIRCKAKHLLLICMLAQAACGDDSGEAPSADDGADSAPLGSKGDGGRGANKADAGKTNGSATADAASHEPSAANDEDAGSSGPADAGRGSRDAGGGDGGNVTTEAGESGRLVGITAAHNAVRAKVMASPMLADMVWDRDVAAYAQQWADMLAMTSCSTPRHRSGAELQQKGYGENLATFGATQGAGSTAQQAVSGWAAEVACWTYGTFAKTDKCDSTCYKNLHSDGCGHYTQVVWRKSTRLGCGVASCMAGQFKQDIWICNYSPAGNYVGQAPY
ncbi:MAG: hypothetical protein JWN48_2046 [Myxococcaceae bacterium]|nr:hypothetical protein [Myxococcaceae bacterium]